MSGPSVQLASTPTDRDMPRMITSLMKRGWMFELKYDGIRAVVTRTATGDVSITNRKNTSITHRYPDVVAAVQDWDFVGTLDGEIICPDQLGRPDFAAVHHRDAQSSPAAAARLARVHPAQFMPFDALEDAGDDLRAASLNERREHLERMAPAVSPARLDGHAMWTFVLDYELEGLIAKNPQSPYRAGRSAAWVKLKAVRRVHALVGGVTAGKGSRAIGALNLYLLDAAGELVSIGAVGSGISDRAMTTISQRLATGQPLVVEVEFLQVSAGGQLRMPVFIGVSEAHPLSCTMNTLK